MRHFCKMRKEMQLISESSSLCTSCFLVQVQKRPESLKSTPAVNPGGKWDELARRVTNENLVQEHPILKDAKASKKEN